MLPSKPFMAVLLSAFSSAIEADIDWSGLRTKTLVAVPHPLNARAGGFALRTSILLSYHDASSGDTSVDIKIESDRPFLHLGQNEALLKDVYCTKESMSLSLDSRESYRQARHKLISLAGSYIITRHRTCNDEGEHGVYKVTDIQAGEHENSIRILVVRARLFEAFPRHRIRLRKREPLQGNVQSLLGRNVDLLPSTLRLPEDADAPLSAAAEDGTSSTDAVSVNLTHSLVNKSLQLPLGLKTNIPLTLTCKNCSTFGSIELSRTDFDFVTPSRHQPLPLEGSFTMSLNNFSAIVELESELTGSFEKSFRPFPMVPLVGYKIPGILTIGVVLDLPIAFSVNVKGGLIFKYGFTVDLPGSAAVTVTFPDLRDSSTDGFHKLKFEEIPFNANVSALKLSAAVALQPTVFMGFKFDEVDMQSRAGVFLSLPEANLAVSLFDKPESCGLDQVLPDTTFVEHSRNVTRVTEQSSTLLAELGDVVHVEPSVNVGVGLLAESDELLSFLDSDKETSSVATSTVIASRTIGHLATACMAYDSSRSSMLPATQVLSSIVKAASSRAVKHAEEAASAVLNATNEHRKSGAVMARYSSPLGFCFALSIVLFAALL